MGMCSDVTGTIAVVFMTSQGACSECHSDNRCCFSDVTGTIAVVTVTSEVGSDITGVCVVTSQGQ